MGSASVPTDTQRRQSVFVQNFQNSRRAIKEFPDRSRLLCQLDGEMTYDPSKKEIAYLQLNATPYFDLNPFDPDTLLMSIYLQYNRDHRDLLRSCSTSIAEDKSNSHPIFQLLPFGSNPVIQACVTWQIIFLKLILRKRWIQNVLSFAAEEARTGSNGRPQQILNSQHMESWQKTL